MIGLSELRSDSVVNNDGFSLNLSSSWALNKFEVLGESRIVTSRTTIY